MKRTPLRSSLPLRVVRKLPLPVALVPERVVINFALALVGLGVLVTQPQPGSVLDTWAPWLLYTWALAMAVGGGSVMWGLFRRKTTIERLGYLLLGSACFSYGLDLIVVRGLLGLTSGLIFVGIGACQVIRMVISSANRDIVIEMGRQMDRDAEDVITTAEEDRQAIRKRDEL